MRQLLHGAFLDGGGYLLAMTTLLFFVFFVTVAIRAFLPSHRALHDEAALLPLDDELEAS